MTVLLGGVVLVAGFLFAVGWTTALFGWLEAERRKLVVTSLEIEESHSLSHSSGQLLIKVRCRVEFLACRLCDVSALEQRIRDAIVAHIRALATRPRLNPDFEVPILDVRSLKHDNHRLKPQRIIALSVTPANYAEKLRGIADHAEQTRQAVERKEREDRERERIRQLELEESRGMRIHRHLEKTEDERGGWRHHYKDVFINKRGEVWTEHTHEFEAEVIDDGD